MDHEAEATALLEATALREDRRDHSARRRGRVLDAHQVVLDALSPAIDARRAVTHLCDPGVHVPGALSSESETSRTAICTQVRTNSRTNLMHTWTFIDTRTQTIIRFI